MKNPFSDEPVPRTELGRVPDNCPTCGKYVQSVARKNVLHPKRGIVREPYKYLPCGHYISPDEEPGPKEWTSTSA
jgi:hypothetical protein